MTDLIDHDVVGDAPLSPAPPLLEVPESRRRSAAEEARTLAATVKVASLATLTEDGDPWASMVTYGAMSDGSPVLYVSTLAEHGRNLHADPRASLVIVADPRGGDPLDSSRVTLAGRVRRPEGDDEEAARAAHIAAIPSAEIYSAFGDFSLFVLEVERVRWVGGYGRMDSADAAAYATAEPDPTAASADGAIAHLNADHADALLEMTRALGGHPDATEAGCVRLDRYGLDLRAATPRGVAAVRVGFAEPVVTADGVRAATVALARRARTV